MRHVPRRPGPAGALRTFMAALVISAVAAGCGDTSSASRPTTTASSPTAAAPAGAGAATPAHPGRSPEPAEASSPSSAPSQSATSLLFSVESDEQTLDAASAASDADFNAGTAAQSQNDLP